MKKIILGLFLSAAMLTSCDMDTTNFGVIDQETAIESRDDAQGFINGIYIQLRSLSAGSYTVFGEMQMDQFIGTVDNGNRLGNFSTGQLVANDTDLANLYYAVYNCINASNYFLPKAEILLAREDISDSDKQLISYYAGAAKFARAYSYWWLFDKFVNYSEANLNTPGMGVQIETEYHPSADRATYVGRSTIKESIDFINKDLAEAFTACREYETNVSAENCNPNATRISSYTVEALQARLALQCGDYATALAKAEDVINSGNYELCGTDTYADMWVNDEGNELLFVPYATQGQGGIQTGINWLTNGQKNTSDYIPTASVLAAYEEGDVRFDAFFELYQPMVISGENYYIFAFNKFPGNPALNTTASNSLLNKAKPFRLSELYLIAAEAAASDGAAKNETKANGYLNELRTARIEGYAEINYSGASLMTAIREERAKELIGEGFRLGDLRRWGNGFTRKAEFDLLGSPFSNAMNAIDNRGNNLTYQPDDYRFVWPIPFREMQVNPQLKGQQNPRY